MSEFNGNTSFDYEKFIVIADISPIMIWFCDIERQYRYFNPEWNSFTGQPAQQQYGQDWTKLIHPEDIKGYLETFNRSFDQEEVFKTSFRIRHRNGPYREVIIKGTPQYSDGVLRGYIGVCFDLETLQDRHSTPDEFESNQNLSDELSAVNEELRAANEELMAANDDLKEAQDHLSVLNNDLESLVTNRTAALAQSESEAQALNEELRATNEELTATNEELLRANDDLFLSRTQIQIVNEELVTSKAAVEKSERLFKSIAVNIPNSIIVLVDTDHRFIAIEGDLMEKLGYKGNDYVGKHPSEVGPSERYEANRHNYERMLSGERFTVEQVSPTGAFFLVNYVPLRNEQQEIYAGLIIAIDITKIKEAQNKSAHLAAIVESSDDAIISKTLNSIVTSWNQSAERLFGYSATEIIGQPILKLIPSDRLDEEEHIIKRLKEGERVNHFETLRQTKDGRLIHVSLTISPINDEDGNIIGASKIVRDITERKQDEQRKNDFIAMVSHELKTPLTTLTAIIQLLKLKLESSTDEFISGAVDRANVQAKRMINLIHGFLDVSRLESGKLQIEKEDFQLGSLINDLVEEARFTTPDHPINFIGPCDAFVHADRNKIGSVINNLLSNAAKYSPAQRPIDVDCLVNSNTVTVSVKDHGNGIEAKDAQRIFERFYRVETGNSQHVSGFGIGLYLCHEIISRHGGSIWVESEIGKGSTFCFRLPLSR